MREGPVGAAQARTHRFPWRYEQVSNSRIRKAVIPAAGYGTRLRPLTAIAAKELLPLGPKPAAQFIVEELHAIGIEDIIFVVSPHKGGIQEYFGHSACGGDVRVDYVFQETQKGLADAILRAEYAVEGEEFLVALGDSVITHPDGGDLPVSRLIRAYESNPAFAAIMVERVPLADAHKYGMVAPVGEAKGAFEITDLIEKPKPEETPSDCAIAGRYIFHPEIFDWIRRTPPGFGGEHQITDSIKLSLQAGSRIWCVVLDEGENRYDIGSISTYCEAFTAMCMLDSEIAPIVRAVVEAKTD